MATYRGLAQDDRWMDGLSEEYFRAEWLKQLPAAAQRDLGPVVVSAVGDVIVGFATGRWIGEPDLKDGDKWRQRFVELMEAYILPEHQRKPRRHGTRLLLELHRNFSKHKWVVGHVAKANRKARDVMRSLSPYREAEDGELGLGLGVMVERATYIWKGPELRETLEQRSREVKWPGV
jgi:hypothetical protein